MEDEEEDELYSKRATVDWYEDSSEDSSVNSEEQRKKMNNVHIRQPVKLKFMPLKTFSDWITSQAEALIALHERDPIMAHKALSKQVKLTKNYVARNLPGIFYNKLVNKVLQSFDLIIDKIDYNSWLGFTRLIETVLSKNVTILSILTGSRDIFKALIKCKVLAGLEQLGLRYNVPENVVIKILKKSHCLKRLSIRWIATKDVLKCLATNCKQLEELILVDCEKITDDDLVILSKLRNLRSFKVLRDTGVRETGIEKLLMSCPNIEYVYCKNTNVEGVIEHISKFKENAGKQFNLTSYINCYNRRFGQRSLEQLQVFSKHCPFIQEVRLENTDYSINPIYLKPLKELQHLRKLELKSFYFYSDGVNEVIKARGCNLTQLELAYFAEIDLHSLKYISMMCPNLENLLLTWCGFVNQNLGHELIDEEIPVLAYLESFKLVCSPFVQPASEHIYFLLTNCRNAEFLEIRYTDLVQETIMLILDKNPKNFMYLKEFLTDADLSLLIIDRIVQNCIHPPKVVKKC